TVEVPAAAAGTLSEIAVKEGETVEVGALLGMISAGNGAKAAAPEPAKASTPDTKQDAVSQASAPTAASTVRQAAAETAKIAGDAGPIEARTMPPAPAAAKLL
ncbi:MAG: dihydrolipoamide succinyltransferase, partial [Mesorhizobium sp.]